MTVSEIFSRLKTHILEGMVFHDEMVRYYSFLGLHDHAEKHMERYEDETKGYRKLCGYYLSRYNELIPERPMERPEVIPESWYRYEMRDVDPNTRENAMRTGHEKWVRWEQATKSLYEEMCRELFNQGEVAASMFLSCYVKDVDEELAEAQTR